MIYAAQGLLILFTTLLASKDGDIYHLVRITDYAKDKEYIKSWHIKGAIIYLLLIAIGCYYEGWKIVIAGLLIRVSLYDVIFNVSAGLNTKSIGTTAASDKFFSKVFGPNGAIKKAAVFFLILIVLNVLNQIL